MVLCLHVLGQHALVCRLLPLLSSCSTKKFLNNACNGLTVRPIHPIKSHLVMFGDKTEILSCVRHDEVIKDFPKGKKWPIRSLHVNKPIYPTISRRVMIFFWWLTCQTDLIKLATCQINLSAQANQSHLQIKFCHVSSIIRYPNQLYKKN